MLWAGGGGGNNEDVYSPNPIACVQHQTAHTTKRVIVARCARIIIGARARAGLITGAHPEQHVRFGRTRTHAPTETARTLWLFAYLYIIRLVRICKYEIKIK